MHSRSKSESGFHQNRNFQSKATSCYNTSKSTPSSLHNIDHVREVTSQIMDGYHHNPTYDKDIDKEPGHNWKEHMYFLESKLFAANSHIEKLEHSAREDGWGNDKMHEVSAAMKEFMSESERKETEYKKIIDSLQNENKEKSKLLSDCKIKADENQREQERKLQNGKIESNEKLTLLERLVKQKDDELKTVQKEISDCQNNLLHMNREKMKIFSESKATDLLQSEELKSMQKLHDQSETEKGQLRDEVLRQTLMINKLKSIEHNLTGEMKFLQQELEEKSSKIKELNLNLKTMETTHNNTLDKLAESERKMKHLTEIERMQEAKHRSGVELQKKNDVLQDEIKKSSEENDAMSKSVIELQQCNSNLMSRIQEQEQKLTNTNDKFEERIIREHLLKQQLYQNQQVERSGGMVKQCNSNMEDSLKQAVSNANAELKAASEENRRLRIEKDEIKTHQSINALKDKIKNVENNLSESELQNTKLRTDIESFKYNNEEYERSLCQAGMDIQQCESTIMEYRIQHEASINQIDTLTSKMNEFEECRKERDTMRCQLQQLAHTMEDYERLKRSMSINDSQLRETLVQKSNEISDIEKKKKILEDNFKLLSEESKKCLQKKSEYMTRNKQLENECHHLNSSLIELKHFMTYARREIEMLRLENQSEAEINQKVCAAVNNLESEIVSKNNEIEQYKQDLNESKKQFEELATNCDRLSKSNSDSNSWIKEREVEIKSATERIQKYEASIVEYKTRITNLNNDMRDKNKEAEYFKTQSYDLVQTLEDTHKELVDASHKLDDEKRIGDRQKQDINELQKEFEKCQDMNNTYQRKLSALIDNERVYQKKLLAAENKIKSSSMTSEEIVKLQQGLNEVITDRNAVLNTLKGVEKRNKDLMTSQNETQNQISSLSTKLSTSREENKRKDEYMNELKVNKMEMEGNLKEMESKLKFCNECKDEFKEKNNQLSTSLHNLKEKKAASSEESYVYSTSINDLQKENQQLQLSCRSMEEQMAALKATLIELQGIIDGNNHKHTWTIQHGQEQCDEIKYLKQNNSDLQQYIFQMKEQIVRAQFVYEKIVDDFNTKSKNFDVTKKEKEKLNEELANISEFYKNQISMLQHKLKNLMEKDEENITEQDLLKLDYDNLVEKLHDAECSYKVLHAKHENGLQEIERLKSEEEKYLLRFKSDELRTSKFKSEFIKLVALLKQLKKERDSFKAVLQTSEDEKVQLKRYFQKLQDDLTKIKKDFMECAHENKKSLSDNEALKSRLNILKFTEETRDCEHKEVLAKLKDYEKKLKILSQDAKHVKVHDTTNLSGDLKQDIPPPILYQELINNLRNMLSTKPDKYHFSTKESDCTGTDSLRDLLQSVQLTETCNRPSVYRHRHPMKKEKKKVERKKLLKINVEKSNIESMFEEYKALQDSVLSEIVDMTKNISYSFDF